jgi:fumarylacetoacetase
VLSAAGLLDGLPGLTAGVFGQPTLNGFMATARPTWQAVRARLTALLRSGSDGDPALRDNAALRAVALVPLVEVEMHLPAKIGDYTDFYSSREHATNVGEFSQACVCCLLHLRGALILDVWSHHSSPKISTPPPQAS